VRTGLGSGISAGLKNPFPGMNPWLEEFWRDVRAKLLVYACDLLNTELPPGLHARAVERMRGMGRMRGIASAL
jgi:hypothetical protein